VSKGDINVRASLNLSAHRLVAVQDMLQCCKKWLIICSKLTVLRHIKGVLQTYFTVHTDAYNFFRIGIVLPEPNRIFFYQIRLFFLDQYHPADPD